MSVPPPLDRAPLRVVIVRSVPLTTGLLRAPPSPIARFLSSMYVRLLLDFLPRHYREAGQSFTEIGLFPPVLLVLRIAAGFTRVFSIPRADSPPPSLSTGHWTKPPLCFVFQRWLLPISKAKVSVPSCILWPYHEACFLLGPLSARGPRGFFLFSPFYVGSPIASLVLYALSDIACIHLNCRISALSLLFSSVNWSAPGFGALLRTGHNEGHATSMQLLRAPHRFLP